MVSSNQVMKISISLQDKGELESVVSLLINGFSFIIRSYRIINGNIIFSRYENEKDFKSIEKEDSNVNFISSLIRLYTESNEFKVYLNQTISDCSGLDGSSEAGLLLNFDTIKCQVILQPYWCFYHK